MADTAPLLKALDAAIAAAEKYGPTNLGDQSEAEFCISLLGDVRRHAEQLDDLSKAYERRERLVAAQAELNAAQSA